MARQQCRVADRRPDVMATAPELVIFDCDGVLVDSEPISMRVLLETLATAGLQLDVETAYARFLGTSMKSICAKLAREDGIELDETALELLRRRLHAAFRAELQPIPGVAATLDRLTLPFCVASSSQPERIELSLGVTGLEHHFTGKLFSASMVEHGKPAPDLFLHAARSMGMAPETALVVEDSPVGIAAARAAGMRVIGFAGGTHARRPAHRAAIQAAGPDALIDDMTRLLETIDARDG
jgi:HAD superfamily hydrolase (TIGR01509 family)